MRFELVPMDASAAEQIARWHYDLPCDFYDLDADPADYDADAFELAVATFNERAIAVYENLGFERVETFRQETDGGEYEFLRMRRE